MLPPAISRPRRGPSFLPPFAGRAGALRDTLRALETCRERDFDWAVRLTDLLGWARYVSHSSADWMRSFGRIAIALSIALQKAGL